MANLLISGIVGHELFGDTMSWGGGTGQTMIGLVANGSGGLSNSFAEAVELDRLGRAQERDRVLLGIVGWGGNFGGKSDSSGNILDDLLEDPTVSALEIASRICASP